MTVYNYRTRSVGDVVADLRGPMEPFAWAAYLAEAADLLERLDADYKRLYDLSVKISNELHALDALRPPGVSWKQIAATYRAVHELDRSTYDRCEDAEAIHLLNFLRSVVPNA